MDKGWGVNAHHLVLAHVTMRHPVARLVVGSKVAATAIQCSPFALVPLEQRTVVLTENHALLIGGH